MLIHTNSCRREQVTGAFGGEGLLTIAHLLDDAQLGGTLSFCAVMTFALGASAGFHYHVKDAEVYVILQGNGDFDDNGTTVPIGPGDITYTAAGEGHAIANTGTEDLVLLAFITK